MNRCGGTTGSGWQPTREGWWGLREGRGVTVGAGVCRWGRLACPPPPGSSAAERASVSSSCRLSDTSRTCCPSAGRADTGAGPRAPCNRGRTVRGARNGAAGGRTGRHAPHNRGEQ